MSDAAGVLDAPTELSAQEGADGAAAAGAVVLLVDGSVSAIAAAAWAGRLARDRRTGVLVVALTGPASDRDDVNAVVARVQPTLDRTGRPWSVRLCAAAGGSTAARRAARTARRVRALLPPTTAVLVCPGAAADLALRLAVERPVDVLVVPDLRALPDATTADDAVAAGGDADRSPRPGHGDVSGTATS